MVEKDPFFLARENETERAKASIRRIARLATSGSRYADNSAVQHAVGLHYHLDDLEGAIKEARLTFIMDQNASGRPAGITDEASRSIIAEAAGAPIEPTD